MEAADRILRRKKQRSKRFIIISSLVAVAVALAVIIPVAIVFTRRNHSSIGRGVASTVLVPLYIYPDSGAWDPLYEVVTSHPGLNFAVIINPENGPGSSRYPSDDYTSQIQRLNTYSNVRTLGYVRVDYANRDVQGVLQDVSTYSGWATLNASAIAMHGIFFDETPSEYSVTNAAYLKSVNQAVKDALGLQANKTIIHNPGTIPDIRYNDSRPDVTVVLENTYSDWQSQRTELVALPRVRSQYAYILHSVPENADLEDLIDATSGYAEFLFLTTLTQNYYESFGKKWKQFNSAMAA